ncbi:MULTISPECIES: glycine betaine/L-proline ABC transporter ATP-binding protein [unclassified Ectothiorhodospira]|uniref:quaternary amine ABC transporter ATP-binding protein n=1 Tax=unclassified Ectothiorhodospira TaxID=2684909 RepID=UPI001EE89091|nr:MULTISPECIES: glycine betaine/L-proline ABC transporter ATP-binding protein [unclassified Ectothiorhodospira]MCG5517343.1 glycine betaine/L-proline ABC transporter ATP-binding protein [Ectothiorhodospira sp. 9100]MCG5520208.1 glycine betaine/L-proline ABC transporter ATP-binding protein [Ectothiorhodospira sp. 9905]
MQPKIQVKNVTKVFGDHPERALELLDEGLGRKEILQRTGQTVGIQNVCFDVAQGEILVVMGLSGCGKSTLIRCLNRLIEPTSGEVVIDGEDILKLSNEKVLERRRRKFGMVFQNFALFPHRTILDNAGFGLEIGGADKATRDAKATEALKLVGLDGWEQSYPSQLSGGMQQRVGLARALAVDPDILLMDEAFSALDPLIRRDMQDELLALQSRVKKTIVFITHDLDEALRLGDRIVLMKDGYVVQIGTPEDILTSPATRYVERFVEDVDKTQVLTAGALMHDPKIRVTPNDGPRTALHKMDQESFYSVFVTQRDGTLEGYVWAEDAAEAVKRKEKTLEGLIQRDHYAVKPDESLGTLFQMLVDTRIPLAVVDDHGKLLGTIVKTQVLAALADAQPDRENTNEEEGEPAQTQEAAPDAKVGA